jgi:uncharacterized protein YbaP (TraB family)
VRALLAAIILIAGCAHHGTGANKPVGHAAPVVEADGPFLWKVTGKHGTSYVFGAGGVGADLIPPVALDALASAKTYALELDASTMKSNKVAQKMMLADPSTESLDEMVGKQTWAQITAIVGPDMADQLTAMKAYAVVGLLMASTEPPGDNIMTLLTQAAKSHSKSLAYIDTAMTYIGDYEAAWDDDSLKEVAAKMDKVRAQMKALDGAYRSGNGAVIDKLIRSSVAFSGKAYDVLIVKRNQRWAPRVAELIDQGDVFVAVKVEHVVGPDSLIQALRDRGYTVTRVPAPAEPATPVEAPPETQPTPTTQP